MASTILISIPPAPVPQRLTLPGGVTIEHLELARVVQPALSPLMPFFNVLEAVLATFDAVRAVPESIGPPPDPSALIEALQKLAEKIAKLLRLVPQLSLPLTVVGLIDLVIHTLMQTRRLLVHLQARASALDALEALAAELGDPQLAAIAACARANIRQEAANLGAQLGPLGSVLGILNLLAGMVGAPAVPDLSSISGQPLETVLEPLDALVEVLRGIRAAVPLP
jgi:hypothetical protein